MFSTTKPTYHWLVAVVAALLLAACSSQSAPTPAPSSPTSVPVAVANTAVSPTAAPASDTVTKVVATEVPTAMPAVTKINLNTATAEQILTVPNAGNRMVREFQEYRPYASISEFRKAIGKYVDAAQVSDYEKYVYVPVSPNNADVATLQQLSGVDQAKAEQLIAARPYADKAAFLKKLGELISAEQANAVATMVEAQ